MLLSTLFGAIALISPSLAAVLPSADGLTSRAAKPPRQVFAHYMLGDIPDAQWTKDIKDAKASGIDGFALNGGPNDAYTDSAFQKAYKAAAAANFKIFISFDMAAGDWTVAQVTKYINEFKASPAQLKVNGLPFVSTFEGPNWSGNWPQVRTATGGIYLVPAWTSIGSEGVKAKLSTIDGAFNWNAWPETGQIKKDTQGDKALQTVLGQTKSYMMGISPWFYTKLPQWNKNWNAGSDTLWFDRWEQALDLLPDFIEIITWNDYGESHYICDTYEQQIVAGAKPYVDGFPHQAFRFVLPYYIAAFKAGKRDVSLIKTEGAIFWYRTTPATICSDGGTTCGSNGPAAETCTKDTVNIMTAFKKATTITVKVGGVGQDFPVKAGVQLVQLPYNGKSGAVTVTVNGKTTTGPQKIANTCPAAGYVNFNVAVGSTV